MLPSAAAGCVGARSVKAPGRLSQASAAFGSAPKEPCVTTTPVERGTALSVEPATTERAHFAVVTAAAVRNVRVDPLSYQGAGVIGHVHRELSVRSMHNKQQHTWRYQHSYLLVSGQKEY